MCSVNHDLKAIYIHIHKTGGTTMAMNLKKYYNFQTYYLRRPDHSQFCLDRKKKKYINYENRIHGIINYYKTSKFINRKMNMNQEKWNTYFKFCFIRNPYEGIYSRIIGIIPLRIVYWNSINYFSNKGFNSINTGLLTSFA